MKKTFVFPHARAALAGLAVIGSLAFAQTSVACPQANSAGNPAVDQQHVFCGEVSGGAAKGLHSRPGGVMPNSAANTPATTVTVSPTMPAGIYALNNFTITQAGQTRTKTISTMFPDACTQANVVAAIQNAYNNRTSLNGTRFTGPSGASCGAGTPAVSFDIVGFLDSVGGSVVRTAYPAY
ncbi:EndoU domain-containing protein [Pseudomonas sichuanensis]|uniref:EndoU domain-containing protein n=1 Tax=Pseudomonas sichuanensis TaxID=2213015 RepID=UPI00244B32A3|nr:EndoU domain-containing protein [Pseudomonas sichuanensis]MDH0731826.1 EndoU domain-containing protein [Pseudomonas sichuanensis]MDH1583908.1 EndoU domain-containing protein [Pseudomonas sichuanensis]MDH1592418.1 EndoU domain-containing protein [Pseudomonas sichuanensis]MDH1598169.1 EndoU domain-containing protein [Pseudomonas sichuanensis]